MVSWFTLYLRNCLKITQERIPAQGFQFCSLHSSLVAVSDLNHKTHPLFFFYKFPKPVLFIALFVCRFVRVLNEVRFSFAKMQTPAQICTPLIILGKPQV